MRRRSWYRRFEVTLASLGGNLAISVETTYSTCEVLWAHPHQLHKPLIVRIHSCNFNLVQADICLSAKVAFPDINCATHHFCVNLFIS